LQHIEQDERVSTGLNGDLYFSHAVEKDSRRDYCCYAAFPRIRTIVQKTAMSVNVKTRLPDWVSEPESQLKSPAANRKTLGDTIILHNAKASDSAVYQCEASNRHGKILSNANIMIMSTTAQLLCLAEYDKSFSNDFELLWEKDNAEIALNYTENSRYIMEDSNLHIINISHGDQGVYRCVAKTPVDRDTASAFLMVLEFIIEYEENKWEPGNWKELLRVPGNHNSAVLKLHGHVEYRFRVYALSMVGKGPPSKPTERYKTPPSGPRRPTQCLFHGVIWCPQAT
ncbi:hypothetical protein GOODEAATRI_008867, partial [Goodea atripinnis]